MENKLEVFNNSEFGKVRTMVIDNEPWFVAKDVCECLEIKNSRDALSRLDDDEKGVVLTDTLGGKQEMTTINEYGLYSLVLGSRKKEAKDFKRWITHEVLPSIRKTGRYEVKEEFRLPQTYSEALRALADKAEENEKQKLLLAEQQPKVEFFDAVAESKTAVDIASVAKVLNIQGIGRNKLFEILRNKKILMNNNQPYQKYIDCNYFRTVEQKFNKPDGSVNINIKTLVYQKGVQYIKKVLTK